MYLAVAAVDLQSSEKGRIDGMMIVGQVAGITDVRMLILILFIFLMLSISKLGSGSLY